MHVADADARVAGRFRSLAPDRAAPRALEVLSREVGADLSSEARAAVAQGLAEVALAIVEHFPENLFADLDCIAGALADAARRSPDEAARTADALVELHALYGRATTIRFRYVHDFLYGFDWARWVAAAPSERAGEPPFGAVFLARSLRRGRELLALIDENDPKYRRLAPGEVRSPFPFRRDPEAEATLLRALATDGAIPVRAWEIAPRPVWERPFVALREAKAGALGLLA